MLFMSVSLAVFGLGIPFAAPATPTTGDPIDPVDYRCKIISIEENSGHPFSSELLEGLLIEPAGPRLRVATFDVNLTAASPGALAIKLAGGNHPHAQQVAAAIQESDADILLLTGMDADEDAVRIFNDEYLNHARTEGRATDYPHRYVGPSNKGVQSGADLDQDKIIGSPVDAWGSGEFPGQGSMVLLSKHPIEQERIATLTQLRWADMPDSRISEAQLSEAVASAMPVMESALWDVPVTVAGQEIRVIATQIDAAHADTEYAGPRRLDQLNAIGDWISAEDYLRGDHGVLPAGEGSYVVVGELGQGAGQNTSIDQLLETIGVAEQGVHNESHYILPDTDLEIQRHGSIPVAPAPGSAVNDGSPTVTGSNPGLLFSELKF